MIQVPTAAAIVVLVAIFGIIIFQAILPGYNIVWAAGVVAIAWSAFAVWEANREEDDDEVV